MLNLESEEALIASYNWILTYDVQKQTKNKFTYWVSQMNYYYYYYYYYYYFLSGCFVLGIGLNISGALKP
jgi:hypothetical protein